MYVSSLQKIREFKTIESFFIRNYNGFFAHGGKGREKIREQAIEKKNYYNK